MRIHNQHWLACILYNGWEYDPNLPCHNSAKFECTIFWE